MDIKNMDIDELKKLDTKVLTDTELEQLQEHPSVKWFENMGVSGYKIWLTWWDVLLIDGTSMDVYTK